MGYPVWLKFYFTLLYSSRDHPHIFLEYFHYGNLGMRHTYTSHEFRFVCVILCYTNEWLHFLKFIVWWKVIHSFGLVLKLLNFFLFSLEIYLLEIELFKIFGMFLFNSAKGIVETLLQLRWFCHLIAVTPIGQYLPLLHWRWMALWVTWSTSPFNLRSSSESPNQQLLKWQKRIKKPFVIGGMCVASQTKS